MDTAQYTKLDRTMSMSRANVLSFALLVPTFFLPCALFSWMWDTKHLITGLEILYRSPLIFIASLFILVILHELIHGLTWQWMSSLTRQDIHYGFKWKTLTPYAHVEKPIDVHAYRWGGAMPGILTGLLPALLGLVLGSGIIFLVGIIMTAVAAGDIMILWLLRKDKSPALVEDHPSRAGCYVLVEKKEGQQ